MNVITFQEISRLAFSFLWAGIINRMKYTRLLIKT